MRPDVERRSNKLRFSREINLGNVIAIVVLSFQCYTIFQSIGEVKLKVDLMWNDYNNRIINRSPTVVVNRELVKVWYWERTYEKTPAHYYINSSYK